MSVRVLGIEWEGIFCCIYCGSSCSTSQWSEPHKKKYCLSRLQEQMELGQLVRSPENLLGDELFEQELKRVGWLKEKSNAGQDDSTTEATEGDG